ncbi:MAG: hypothetical protein LBB62_04720 [Proteiniphilum sp.]|jgi:hypothetical protein|nr:hypothetical protein [Proteiniphilum sp.]
MDIQWVIIILTGIAVAVKLVHSLYKLFFVKKDSSCCGRCPGCAVSKKHLSTDL